MRMTSQSVMMSRVEQKMGRAAVWSVLLLGGVARNEALTGVSTAAFHSKMWYVRWHSAGENLHLPIV